MTNKPFFSIVIPTLNEEKYLPLLLEDLSNQTYKNFEVIHVDGNSEDDTIKNASKYKKQISIESHLTNVRNVSVQRNLGIENSKSEWIIFMDADNRLPTYFLDGIRYKLAINQETEIFTTWVSIDKEKTLNKPIERTINFGLELGKMTGKEWSLGALIGVKKSIIKKEYYFDKKQKVGEDGIFVKKLVDNNHKFSIFTDPKYTYSVRRLDSEGTVKVVRTSARLAINYLQGKDFSKSDFGYKMDGGDSYSDQKYFNYYNIKNYYGVQNYYNIQTLIKTGTKKQIEQAKRLFKSLTQFDF
jgi:glycosyltransferase involved in cell wall biosynthesis